MKWPDTSGHRVKAVKCHNEVREVWQTSLNNPDFAVYAELCGVPGIQVANAEDLDDALEKTPGHPGPALVEVMTDAELV